jgi:hypothetical protein
MVHAKERGGGVRQVRHSGGCGGGRHRQRRGCEGGGSRLSGVAVRVGLKLGRGTRGPVRGEKECKMGRTQQNSENFNLFK